MEELRKHICDLIAARNRLRLESVDQDTFEAAQWWLEKELNEAYRDMDALLRQGAA